MNSERAIVEVDGQPVLREVNSLEIGDRVLVQAGDLVPADLRLEVCRGVPPSTSSMSQVTSCLPERAMGDEQVYCTWAAGSLLGGLRAL